MAQKGNKNAEKYSKEVVLKHLSTILKSVKTEKIFYIGVALVELDLYPEIWSIWSKKFEDDILVIQAIKRVEAQIEANILRLAGTNQMNTAIAIFVLKNKYKWSDKQEIDHTSRGESIVWQENKTYGKGNP